MCSTTKATNVMSKGKKQKRTRTNQSAPRCLSLGWLLLCCCVVFVPVGVSLPAGATRPPLADSLRVFILQTRAKHWQSEGFHLPPPSMTHQGSAALESCLKKQTVSWVWTPQGIDNILTLLVLLQLKSCHIMWRFYKENSWWICSDFLLHCTSHVIGQFVTCQLQKASTLSVKCDHKLNKRSR